MARLVRALENDARGCAPPASSCLEIAERKNCVVTTETKAIRYGNGVGSLQCGYSSRDIQSNCRVLVDEVDGRRDLLLFQGQDCKYRFNGPSAAKKVSG